MAPSLDRVALAAILVLSVGLAVGQFCPAPPVSGGSLDFAWDQGAADCSHVSSYVPSLLVNWYDDSTAIIQQRRCVNANAPFLYLLLGEERALLIDTGATADASAFDIQATVEQTLGQWLAARNISRDQYELVVTHTDSSPSHVSGDVQFVGAPGTTLVGADIPSVCKFFDIAQWPFDYGSLSLDLTRSVAVIPTPGPSPASLVFYDCRTDLLFTGELLTPGYISIADGRGALASASRVLEFLMNHATAVSHLLGSHVDMAVTGGAYGPGETYMPNPHNLSLPAGSLVKLFTVLNSSASQPQFPTTVTPDFVVQPSTRQTLPAGGRMGDHGMLVARLVQGSLPAPLLLLSHVPMYRQPHDYQILLLATVSSSSVNPLPVPAPPAATGVYSLDPGVDLSLNDIIEGRTTSLPAQLYSGSFQGTGVIVSNITLSVQSRAVVSWLDNSTAIPYSTSIYFSVPQHASASVSSDNASLFLLHHMKQKPDYDHLIRVTFDPLSCTVGPLGARSERGPRSLGDPFAVGAQWALMGRVNSAATRPLPGQGVLAQLVGDPHDTVCAFMVAEELSCLVGPDFFDNC